MVDSQLTKLESHFAFGENWRAYSQLIDEGRIGFAVGEMRRLFAGDLKGRSFIDLGCGSGIHATAALRLGARQVTAVDLDPVSVETTRNTLERFAPTGAWEVHRRSVLDLAPQSDGQFDVVYSWGVLHHTGAMRAAIRVAQNLVAPDGLLALALYRRTLLCPLWTVEKGWYARASPKAQIFARRAYLAVVRAGLMLRGKSYTRHLSEYARSRGMNYEHDVHDWLGGFPYESISVERLRKLLAADGFVEERSFLQPVRMGLLSSGCSEFVFRRVQSIA